MNFIAENWAELAIGYIVLLSAIMCLLAINEPDDDGIVWQTTKTTSRKVWVNGELVSDETRTVEE